MKRVQDYRDLLQTRELVPLCRFAARNTGNRPATDALVAIHAQGRFEVTRPNPKQIGDEEKGPLWLPSPPWPHGEWISELIPTGARSALEELRRTFAGREYLLNPYGGPSNARDLYRDFMNLKPERHDPNAFYYKSLSQQSGDAVELTCDQWRHGVDAHVFAAEITVPSDTSDVAGAIRFRIDAENLPVAAVRVIPLRLTVGIHG